MTDNEIIKALECCGDTIGNMCSKCPMYLQKKDNDFCSEDLHRNALTLINRQKAEIELKTMDINSLTSERDALQEMVEEQKAEIERLEDVNKCLSRDIELLCHLDCDEGIAYIKSEARKEFAERLKEKATSSFYEERKYVDTEDIDNLLKEMEEN